MEIDWREKGKRGTRKQRKDDVLISSVNGGYHHKATSIYFRNQCYEKITKSGHMAFAIDGNKVFFCDDSAGYKLIYPRPTTNPRITTYTHEYDLSRFVGNYDLLYDAHKSLYFIDKARVKKEKHDEILL